MEVVLIYAVLVSTKMVFPAVVLGPVTLKPVQHVLLTVLVLANTKILLVMEQPPLTSPTAAHVTLPVQLAVEPPLLNVLTVILPLTLPHPVAVPVSPVMSLVAPRVV